MDISKKELRDKVRERFEKVREHLPINYAALIALKLNKSENTIYRVVSGDRFNEAVMLALIDEAEAAKKKLEQYVNR